MVHGNFRDARAGHGQQGRDEPVQAAELEGQVGGPLGAKGLEGAAGVADGFAQDAVAHGVGEAAADALGPDVLPADAIAAAEIAAFQPGDQRGDVGRIVLAVGVEGDENLPARGAEAGEQGGALAGIYGEAHGPQFRDFGAEIVQPPRRPVGRAVVHHEDFERPAMAVQDAGRFADERAKARLFVVGRNENRQLHGQTAFERGPGRGIWSRCFHEPTLGVFAPAIKIPILNID